jgi:hypothetical protein
MEDVLRECAVKASHRGAHLADIKIEKLSPDDGDTVQASG